MNNALKKALVNPRLSSLVSFLPIIAALNLVWICIPKSIPSTDSLSQMPLGGLIGAFAVVAGLLFVGKVGAGVFAGLTITANILMSLVIDKLGIFGVETHALSVSMPREKASGVPNRSTPEAPRVLRVRRHRAITCNP